MGGEKAFFSGKFDETKGSPPRGRGKVNKNNQNAAPEGITPAWAGKRFTTMDTIPANGDHPRVGGEKLMYAALLKYRRGSPPRGRGKVSKGRYGFTKVRITPAWAGKR